MQTQTGPPLVSPIPVSPQQRSRSHWQGMEQDTDLARFACFAPAPLALLPQRTRTAIANAGRIDHAQTAIAFSPLLMRDQDVACRTPKGPIRLEGKVGPGEAASFPGSRSGRWSIPRGGGGGRRCGRMWGLVFVLRWEGRRKLGGAYRFRCQEVPQLQAEIPGPLSHDLPGFLSRG